MPRPGERLPEERHQLGAAAVGRAPALVPRRRALRFLRRQGRARVDRTRRSCGRVPETCASTTRSTRRARASPASAARASCSAERAIGVVGELHPDVVQALELEGRPIWAVLDVADLARGHRRARRCQSNPRWPRFPSATRDIAVVVAEALPAGEVGDALREAAGPMRRVGRLCSTSTAANRCRPGSKSLAFHVVYRDPGSDTDRQGRRRAARRSRGQSSASAARSANIGGAGRFGRLRFRALLRVWPPDSVAALSRCKHSRGTDRADGCAQVGVFSRLFSPRALCIANPCGCMIEVSSAGGDR